MRYGMTLHSMSRIYATYLVDHFYASLWPIEFSNAFFMVIDANARHIETN